MSKMNCEKFIVEAFKKVKEKGYQLTTKAYVSNRDSSNGGFCLVLSMDENDDIVCHNDTNIFKRGSEECIKLLSIFNIVRLEYIVYNEKYVARTTYSDREDFHLDFESYEFGRGFWVETNKLLWEINESIARKQ
jgi:hypothetical protein